MSIIDGPTFYERTTYSMLTSDQSYRVLSHSTLNLCFRVKSLSPINVEGTPYFFWYSGFGPKITVRRFVLHIGSINIVLCGPQ